MVEAEIYVVDRGHVRTDVNRVIEGYRRATASEPEPELLVGDGPVYNLLIDHPDGVILWDTGSHPEAGSGHWPADLYDAFEHYDAEESRSTTRSKRSAMESRTSTTYFRPICTSITPADWSTSRGPTSRSSSTRQS